jgi:hypothetical protein
MNTVNINCLKAGKMVFGSEGYTGISIKNKNERVIPADAGIWSLI